MRLRKIAATMRADDGATEHQKRGSGNWRWAGKLLRAPFATMRRTNDCSNKLLEQLSQRKWPATWRGVTGHQEARFMKNVYPA
jgi:hypothetical protein